MSGIPLRPISLALVLMILASFAPSVGASTGLATTQQAGPVAAMGCVAVAPISSSCSTDAMPLDLVFTQAESSFHASVSALGPGSITMRIVFEMPEGFEDFVVVHACTWDGPGVSLANWGPGVEAPGTTCATTYEHEENTDLIYTGMPVHLEGSIDAPAGILTVHDVYAETGLF